MRARRYFHLMELDLWPAQFVAGQLVRGSRQLWSSLRKTRQAHLPESRNADGYEIHRDFPVHRA